MHEEKEQTQFVVGVGQIHIFGIFEVFFWKKKTTPRRVHLLSCIVVTLPVSHLDRSELKAYAKANAAYGVRHNIQRERQHPSTHKNHSKSQKTQQKEV